MPQEKKTEEKKKPVFAEGKIGISASGHADIMKFDVDTLNKLTSGSCMISSTEQSEKIAVCKEGNTIKIFKIVEEKK